MQLSKLTIKMVLFFKVAKKNVDFRPSKNQIVLTTKEQLTFSPSTTSNSTVSPSPTLRRYFLGLFFLMAVYKTQE